MRQIIAALILATLATASARAQETATAILAGGCFWCVEADFDKVDGVRATVSGYAGGTVENPTYRQVVNGGTGHKEVVQITYDPSVISYERLLHLFMRSIDPTDAGGQFCDRGDSYATAIFVANAEEEAIARAAVAEAEQVLGQDVATEVAGPVTFYPAEDYHQDFYKTNPVRYTVYRQGCRRDARLIDLWGDAAYFSKGS